MIKLNTAFFMSAIKPFVISPMLDQTLLKVLLGIAFVTLGTTSQAEMYKYLTQDGKTILSGERLKGSGNRLIKIYQIKKSKAYKSSLNLTNSKESTLNKLKKNSKKTSKKRHKKTSQKRKSRGKRNSKNFPKLAKANGRDSGIIVGCNSSEHLSKQARLYQMPIHIYSRIYDVDEELIHAIVRQESCFNEGAHSRVGAIGLMQLMPQTALGLRINDPWNPEHNIQGGIKYIAQMLRRFDGKAKLAIAAYNAGPGNVRKYKGIPPFRETRKYVKKVYAEYQRLKSEGIHYPQKIKLALK